jgi:outer membrane protein OmpA-like peptidoglycan-associated protein
MKIRYFISLIFVLLFITPKIKAQPLSKLKTDALTLFNAGKYRQAFDLLQHFQLQKGDDKEVIRALGISAYHANRLPVAKQMLFLLSDYSDKKADPSVFLYLGKTLHEELDFKGAVKAYKEFLRRAKDSDPLRKSVIANIKRCASGMRIVIQPELALVENLGENVNSQLDEFAPIQSPNFDEKVYFSASREDVEGGLRNEEGKIDLKNGHYNSDIYSTTFENGDWAVPAHLENSLIITPRNEVLMDFTNGGRALFFFRGLTQYSGSVMIDTFKGENELRTLPPKFISPMIPEDGDVSFHVFNDSLLVFSSRRSGGYGGLDLYYSVHTNGYWIPAKNFGSNINSSYDETTPFLSKDGRTLYFSSNSTASMGGFDVFKVAFNEDSLRFEKATNLGKPINSAGDDTHFRLTPDGMRGYYCSNRKEGLGERDIYTAIFKAFQKEQTLQNPIAFHLVQDKSAQKALEASTQAVKILQYTFAPIFYDTDDDLLRGVNLTQTKYVLELIKKFPNLKVILTANCNDGEKLPFDLYFTVKRTEKIAKYLIDNGLQNENIVIKSVGAQYPIAVTYIENNPNPAGEKMNRRIDIAITNQTIEPLKVTYDEPVVSQFMVNKAGDKIKRHAKGLTYKVQLLATKRLYDNDLLSKNGDAMLESSGIEGMYQYTVGLFNDFATADKMRKDLQKENIKDAFVVPYIDGMRVLGEEAKRYTSKFGDLMNYLAYRKKP